MNVCRDETYFYDGSILLAEKIGSQIQKIYINDGQGIVGMVRPLYDGSTLTHYQRLYYLHDSLGSVSAVTGEHGLPLQNYTYSPYGTCLNVTGDPINNLQFVGRYGGYLDNDTGLTYFWHRWYDSKDGRWISRDPIGIKGGINLYGYVKNEPNNKIDKNGYDCNGCSTPSGLPFDPLAPLYPTLEYLYRVCWMETIAITIPAGVIGGEMCGIHPLIETLIVVWKCKDIYDFGFGPL